MSDMENLPDNFIPESIQFNPSLQRLSQRIEPISDPIVTEFDMPTMATNGKPVHQVQIKWGSTEPNSTDFDAGSIEVSFVQEIFPSPDSDSTILLVAGEPRFAISAISTRNTFDEKFRPIRNPLAGTKALFTLISTINETARLAEQPIVHISICNRRSLPLLERLVEEGLYHYCFADGSPAEQPQEIKGNTLFACKYPVAGVETVLGKFAVPDAVTKLVPLLHQE